MATFDLDHVTAAIRAHTSEWDNAGLRWQLVVEHEQVKSAARVTCEASQLHAQLVIWTDGDAKVDVTNLSPRLKSVSCYTLATLDDVETCLTAFTQQVTPSS